MVWETNYLEHSIFGEEGLSVYLGDIEISVSEDFFEDKEKFDRIIKAYVKCIVNIKDTLYDSFDEKIADKILQGLITKMSLTYV